jgi:hypothetical protein
MSELQENTEGYTCSDCGEEWDYSFYGTGTADVSDIDIERICWTIDSGGHIHIEE